MKESYLASEIKHLVTTCENGKKEELQAQITNYSKKLEGIWSAINKEKKPRDLIRQLRTLDVDPPQYECSTVQMAELTQAYHQNLQNDTEIPPTDYNQEQQIMRTLEAIPAMQTLENNRETRMSEVLNEENVKNALNSTKNGTAIGINECPYELWKTLEKKHSEDRNLEKEGFDIIKVLTIVYQDIQRNGLDKASKFTLGWMCSLYKKKDPTKICNYRPITLLNTDYKILTKALALQLVHNIEHLIHPNQAGFIRKCSIFNQICLAKSIINYAEVTEENRAIVALDQEKAYDKIKHDYLWKAMKKFGLPHTFIKTVKTLYTNAHTMVAINGIFSKPYEVTRGV